jgi:hypothetical protein
MRRCVALLVTSLAKPRERKVIFSAVKACLLSNSDQIICTPLQKIFPHQSQLSAAIFYFVPSHRAGQNKRPECRLSASHVFASTEKQDDTSFAKI